jgi:hypothetical protein
MLFEKVQFEAAGVHEVAGRSYGRQISRRGESAQYREDTRDISTSNQ